ncbi:MAG TPA: fluoride efflux transporter CrcB [Acidobacteriaceae bacterium]|nr:fluoride efflux transporter CrcB [Acidobacteriaceae bacterium]
MQKYLLIAAGGALGSVARYWVSATVSGRAGTRFPWGTFVVNITACMIIGFAITWLGHHIELSRSWTLLIPIGFIGAYSTFSTYEWELFTTLEAGEMAMAALYAVSSLVLGLAAVWVGAKLASVLSA